MVASDGAQLLSLALQKMSADCFSFRQPRQLPAHETQRLCEIDRPTHGASDREDTVPSAQRVLGIPKPSEAPRRRHQLNWVDGLRETPIQLASESLLQSVVVCRREQEGGA